MNIPVTLLFTLFIHILLILTATRVEAHRGTSESVHRRLSQALTKKATDIDVVLQTRLSIIVANAQNGTLIPAWLATLGQNGKWPSSEIDYTSGCPARRAKWPARLHWMRITTMSAAWHGGLPGAESLSHNAALLSAIGRAMDFWFANDFTNGACLDSGGSSACPCGTPGFWNTNWFSNVILIPNFVGQSCILLSSVLSSSQRTACTRITRRSYDTFTNGISVLSGGLSGANALDVATIGVDLALRTNDMSILTDAYRRIHLELVVKNNIRSDGIRADGSFAQHGGMLYNGGYGKDFANDILDLEIEAAGTQFTANAASRNAFLVQMDGSKWMMLRQLNTGVLHWDYSVLGRFITFPELDYDEYVSFNALDTPVDKIGDTRIRHPYSEIRAPASIHINLTKIRDLGQKWQSNALVDMANSLSQNSANVNAGNLIGNRMFFANDYMVHRGPTYVTTLKMFSQRTINTECINNQNPFGFHLSDGTLYTYNRGSEYRDVFSSWDWNRIPGTTATASSRLACDQTGFLGVPSFIGGASDGEIGVAVMKYTDPSTRTLRWQKTWFFLQDDIQVVMIANITVASGGNRAVFSVLDQKRRNGPIFVNGVQADQTATYASPHSLWHWNVGYTFKTSSAFDLSVRIGPRTGSWSSIGTSTRPPTTVDFFAAWLNHHTLSTPVSYTVFPGTDVQTFTNKAQSTQIQEVRNDARVSAVYSPQHSTIMVTFWDLGGGSATFNPQSTAQLTISSNANIVIVYRLDLGKVIVADPSQKLATVHIVLTLGATGAAPPHWTGRTMQNTVTLPQGGVGGKSVVWTF